MLEENGFTLIENLVALFLLSLLTGVILVIFTQSSRMNNNAREITTAAFLAQDKIEELRGTPFNLVYSMTPLKYEEEIISNEQKFLRQTFLTLDNNMNIQAEVIVKTKKGREIRLVTHKKYPRQITEGDNSD